MDFFNQKIEYRKTFMYFLWWILQRRNQFFWAKHLSFFILKNFWPQSRRKCYNPNLSLMLIFILCKNQYFWSKWFTIYSRIIALGSWQNLYFIRFIWLKLQVNGEWLGRPKEREKKSLTKGITQNWFSWSILIFAMMARSIW